MEVQRRIGGLLITRTVEGNCGFSDLRNPNMDTELCARLRARRMMMDKWEDSNESRSKAPKTSSFGYLKRPHQPDVHHSSPKNNDLVQELDRLKLLYDLRAKDLHDTRQKLQERTVGFEAMTILVQYLSEKLESFNCPILKKQLEEVNGQLSQAGRQLDDLMVVKESLQKNMQGMMERHQTEICRLQFNHQVELQLLEEKLKEEAANERDNMEQLQNCQIQSLKTDHDHVIFEMKDKHAKEIERKNCDHEDERSKLEADAQKRIEEINRTCDSKICDVTKQFEEMKLSLSHKVSQLHNECQELRRREKTQCANLQREAELKTQTAVLPYKYLEQEVESLKAVVDLRNMEISQLRQNNQAMEKQLEEIPKARDTIISLNQKIENLEAIINIKVDYERDLAEKHHVLLRKFDRETKAMKRLSMNNEELTWRLSQTEAGSTPDIFRMLSNTQLSTQSNTSSPTTRTRDSIEPRQRPKSMVLLSPVHSPSSGEKPPLHRPTSGIKLRRPRMFESTDNGNLANAKVGSSLRQSDV